MGGKVEIISEQRQVAFLSPSKIWKHFEFLMVHSRKIKIFANFAGW